MAANFDESMRKITALVGIAAEEVEGMKGRVLELSRETAKAPQELAEALFFVTSAGARGTEALEILEASAKAAAAGLGETAVIADAVTSAVNAYGSEVLSAEQATAILIGTVKAGKGEASTFAPVLGRVIPIAAELGVTFDQVGAALAAMTRLGADANESATSLRQIMVTLLKPSKQAEETLAQFGLSAQGLRQQVREEGLLTVLLQLRDAFGDNEEALTRVFPNIRALTGILNLAGENAEEVEGIFADLAGTTSKDIGEAFEAAQGPAFRMRQQLNELRIAAIKLGEKLLPIAERIVEIVGQMAKRFSELSPGTQDLIIKIALLSAAFGPVLRVMGLILRTGGALVGLFARLGAASAGTAASMGAVGAKAGVLAGLFSPGGALIVGLGLLATGFLVARNDAQQFEGAVETLKEAMLAGGDALEKWNKDFDEFLENSAPAWAQAELGAKRNEALAEAEKRAAEEIRAKTEELLRFGPVVRQATIETIEAKIAAGDFAEADRILTSAIQEAERALIDKANALVGHNVEAARAKRHSENAAAAEKAHERALREAIAAVSAADQVLRNQAAATGRAADEAARARKRTIEYIRALNNIPAVKTTTIIQQFIQTGRATPGEVLPRALGGILRGQQGFITRGPTVLVGEGTSQTFAGRGTEAVIPFDHRGLEILGQAVALGIGRVLGGNPLVHPTGPSPRPLLVSVQIDKREIGRAAVEAVDRATSGRR